MDLPNFSLMLRRKFIMFAALYVLLIAAVHLGLVRYGNMFAQAEGGASQAGLLLILILPAALIAPFLYIAIKRIAANEAAASERRHSRSENRFLTTFENAAVGMAIADDSGRLVEANESLAAMLGYSRDELIGKRIAEITHPEDIDGNIDLYRQLVEGSIGSYQYEKRYVRKDGAIRWGHVSASALKGCEGQCLVAIIKDITERKAAQESILKSLGEKEVLLDEVHYRVKSNMQLMSSLMTIHANYIGDETLERAFDDCMQRIKTISLVYEKVCQRDNYNDIDFARFGESLARIHSNNEGVEVTSRVSVNQLNVKYAVPCALIANELISNALRHAFDAGRPGRVDLTLNASVGGRCALEVRDNGRGLPDPIMVNTPGTLGLYLVKLLVAQIGGEMEVRRDGGTAFRITFEHK